MPKIKLVNIAKKYGVEFDDALSIVEEKLPPEQVTGTGKNTWIGEVGQEILDYSMMIDEITPYNYTGKVISECPNNRYNYVHSKEIGKKVPVLIPARHRGNMVGKTITFEAIEDNAGVSYRFVKN